MNGADENLVRRCGEGDRDAWGAVAEKYSSLVWSVVRGFRFNEAQAADAVQTTWLRFFENASAIRQPERIAGWLRTTASRVCLEQVRGCQREQLMGSYAESPAAASASLRASQDGGPETRVLRQEHQAIVRNAVQGLPERHQRFLEMLANSPAPSYQEISRRLDMPVGSIGPTRARILSRLKKAITAEGLEDMALV